MFCMCILVSIWLNNDQAIRIFGRDAGIVKSTLQSATKALGIAKK